MYSARARITTESPMKLADWPRNRYLKLRWRKTRTDELMRVTLRGGKTAARSAGGGNTGAPPRAGCGG
jgi:hypothetical protein